MKPAVQTWVKEVEAAQWKTSQDIKARYSHASFLSDNRVVFNLKGNNYRLGVKISYKNQTVLVKQVGTHEEYKSWKW